MILPIDIQVNSGLNTGRIGTISEKLENGKYLVLWEDDVSISLESNTNKIFYDYTAYTSELSEEELKTDYIFLKRNISY